MRRGTALFVIILIGAGVYLLWSSMDGAAYREGLTLVVNEEGSSQVRSVEIPQGTSPKGIGALLEERDVIVSADIFARYVKEEGFDRSLQAGTFYVTSAMTIPEIVDVLTGAVVSEEETLTIPEGYRIRDVDALLAQRGLITPGAYIACAETCSFDYDFLPVDGTLEGYLFPDTYNVVPKAFSVEQFMNRQLQTFERKVIDGLAEEIQGSAHTLEEVINMASIVERESLPSDDRALVAGVLWNRYDAGTLIGADATLLYEKDNVKDPITYQDLQSDTPYNTRKLVGLPPTPISNPGLDCIRAALDPKATDYWYYLHDSSGNIYFAETLQEHNINKAKYID